MLSCRGLSRRYGEVWALRGLDLDIRDGECVAVTGPSGCGKTTLLRLLASLDQPTSGEVREDGLLVNSPRTAVSPWRRDVGMLFQNLALWPHLRVGAQIDLVLQGAGLRRRDRRARTDEILERAGLFALRNRFPDTLSGGERQRVAWARAVAPRPRLLLLDEPLTSLDPLLRDDLEELTLREARRPEATLVVVTHDARVAARLGDRVVELGR